jgi:hypothetical protein
MTEDEASTFVHQWWDGVWGKGDLTLIDQIVTDPYIRHSASGNRVVSRKQLKKDMAQYRRTMHEAVTTFQDRCVVEDKIWTRATSRGMNLETHEASVVTWLIVQRLEGPQLAESWSATLTGVDWTQRPG